MCCSPSSARAVTQCMKMGLYSEVYSSLGSRTQRSGALFLMYTNFSCQQPVNRAYILTCSPFSIEVYISLQTKRETEKIQFPFKSPKFCVSVLPLIWSLQRNSSQNTQSLILLLSTVLCWSKSVWSMKLAHSLPSVIHSSTVLIGVDSDNSHLISVSARYAKYSSP
jgi:hypothetical protein